MFPQQYTFQAPIHIPAPKPGMSAFVRVVTGPDGFPAVVFTAPQCFPEIVHNMTRERARLVRAITDDIRDLPRFGKITLTVEHLIWTEQKLIDTWDAVDWSIARD